MMEQVWTKKSEDSLGEWYDSVEKLQLAGMIRNGKFLWPL